ncbi:MAG: SsrA-binding protein [Candidatus Parcubacteria bacterium]|nr:MAG: SsrA-binding protein [Candidatus Parcubacteria bacterium]
MVLIQNREALRNYEILERFVAGIELKGFEVKALFSGKGSLKGAYVSYKGDELFLKNFNLPPYQSQNTPRDYEPTRDRKLLLHRKEINYLLNKIKQPGLTIVPLKIYNQNRLIKVEIALVKGLKKYEKREKIRKREFQRQKERILKGRI